MNKKISIFNLVCASIFTIYSIALSMVLFLLFLVHYIPYTCYIGLSMSIILYAILTILTCNIIWFRCKKILYSIILPCYAISLIGAYYLGAGLLNNYHNRHMFKALCATTLPTIKHTQQTAYQTRKELASCYRSLLLKNCFSHNYLKQSVYHLHNITFSYFNAQDAFQLVHEIFDKQIYHFTTAASEPFIIDAGSNIGLSILYFKQLYPKAHIIGFEPHPTTYDLLKHNIAINNLKNIKLEQKALGSLNRTIAFPASDGYPGNIGLSQYHNTAKHINVEQVPLSSYINQPVDFLKIDVEGAELEIIDDLVRHKKLNYIKQMMIEYHQGIHTNSATLTGLLTTLNHHGFSYVISDLVSPAENIHRPSGALLLYVYKNEH